VIAVRQRVVLVRPYWTGVRSRVAAALARAGLDLRDAEVIAAGTPDDDACRRVLTSGVRILVVPLHAHRDPSGAPLDGLSFLRLLRSRAPERAHRVLMPVSRFAAPAISLAASRGEPGEGVLVLTEDALADPRLDLWVRAHLA
jgi:hypothetical protein